MVAGELENSGRTAVLVQRDGTPVGVLGIADRLRPDAATTVASLTTLTGTTPMLLTGDNPRAATRLAEEVGISDVRAGLLPQDKVTAVQEQEKAGRKVLVIGDGVNDAPALAAAHTGIAMGRAGSDLALETTDAVIVRDELATVPKIVALSRAARRLVVQNLVIAAVFITGLVIWDLAGNLPLPLGVLGHEGSTVIVGLNGLRLLRDAGPPRGRPGPPSPSAAAAAAAPQLTDMRTVLAGVAMVRRTDCLDACERANVIVIQPSAEGRQAGGPPVWLGAVNDPDAATDITTWVKNGGPGLGDPPDILDLYAFTPSRRVRHELDD